MYIHIYYSACVPHRINKINTQMSTRVAYKSTKSMSSASLNQQLLTMHYAGKSAPTNLYHTSGLRVLHLALFTPVAPTRVYSYFPPHYSSLFVRRIILLAYSSSFCPRPPFFFFICIGYAAEKKVFSYFITSRFRPFKTFSFLATVHWSQERERERESWFN